MKKFVTFCLLLVVFSAVVPARADVLWEPDNSFFKRHSEECDYVYRRYLSNGPDGFINLLRAPNSSSVITQLHNGLLLHGTYLYDGWCMAEIAENGDYGWVPLSHLCPVYDSYSFAEEYSSSFQPYQGEFTGYSGSSDGIAFWPYPDAPAPIRVWSDVYSADLLEELTGPDDFSAVFTDEDGHLWGFRSYLLGHKNLWICLDEPTKTDFPVRKIPEPALIPAQKPVPPTGTMLPYLLVGAVMLVTGGLLFVFYRRKPAA